MLKTRRLCSIAILAIVICAMEKPVYADAKETWNHTLATTGFQQQERMDWCWVASARNMAVTKVSNVNVKKTQSDVVKSIKGSVKNCTGSLRDISVATKKFNISCASSYKSSRLSFNTIKGKINKGGGVVMVMQHPLYGKHAILLYAYSSSKNVKVYDSKGGAILCKYANLRDGKVLPGYSYEESVYF
ncbi:MAG: hypothetical protein HFH62_13390 [Lachnospiraceae bacterium]|nr:hypothetical protein [Lachnospiraceae bacterium]